MYVIMWTWDMDRPLTCIDAAFGFTFVSATAMILAGAMLERGRLLPSMVFLLCWTTFVYYM
jgi:Amt family ammonium transporter